MSTLFAILSSLIRVYTICHFFVALLWRSTLFAILSSLIKVFTICHSQQSDQSLHCLPFSAVWSECPLFAILNLISVYTIWLSFLAVWSRSILFAILNIFISVYTTCHSQQFDQGKHYLQFYVWSVSTLLAILSKQYYRGVHCLPFLAVWSGSTRFTILNSLIRVYTICHSQQSDYCRHYLLFSVWSASRLFAILSNLIRVCSICHSFCAVLSRSTLFAILSIVISVYTICYSEQSDQDQRLYCHSEEQSDQSLHYLPFSAVWSGTTRFAILSSVIQFKVHTVILRKSLVRVYTICHSLQSD